MDIIWQRGLKAAQCKAQPWLAQVGVVLDHYRTALELDPGNQGRNRYKSPPGVLSGVAGS